MSFYSNVYSHRFDDKNGNFYGQLLVDHLISVKNIAVETCKSHIHDSELEQVIETIALSHDFGKSSSYFQRYLLKGENVGQLKSHGEISAYLAFFLLPEAWKVIGFLCVKRHHGNMVPEDNLFICNDPQQLKKIAEDISRYEKELSDFYQTDLKLFFQQIQTEDILKQVRNASKERFNRLKKQVDENVVEDYIKLSFLYSLLLTADKSQLIRGYAYKSRKDIKEGWVYSYKETIKQEFLTKYPHAERDTLFTFRNKIYDQATSMVSRLELEKDKLLSINVPTGTGKTLAVYAAAFALFERLNKEKNIRPHIIYNIPFMSVIDQNYDVLKKAIEHNDIAVSEDLILKHHSLSPIHYKDSEEKEYKNYDGRFCVENWQSTIITTTFVQLFDTLFRPGVNSIIHRFHRIASSILILDEVQAIPPKYFRIIEMTMKILCEKFGTYVITVTATKPLFLQGQELIKDSEEIFHSLNRISIISHIHSPYTLEQFIVVLQKHLIRESNKSFLIVMNTVNSALQLFDNLQNDSSVAGRPVRYLSTEILPIDRLNLINEIKESSEKYILISTQLIEAGVDVDFDRVYRDLAPMDSINQTAGRANRNGVIEQGEVHVVKLLNINHSNRPFSSYVYSGPLLEKTELLLSRQPIIEEKDILEINYSYFMMLQEVTRGRCEQQHKDFIETMKRLEFQKIIGMFQLIENQDYRKVDIIVIYNEEVEEKIRIIRERRGDALDIINAWRFLNRYRISIEKKKEQLLLTKDLIYESDIKVKLLDKEYYNEKRGVVPKATLSF